MNKVPTNDVPRGDATMTSTEDGPFIVTSSLELTSSPQDDIWGGDPLNPTRWIPPPEFGFKLTVWNPADPPNVTVYDFTRAARDRDAGRFGTLTVREASREELRCAHAQYRSGAVSEKCA